MTDLLELKKQLLSAAKEEYKEKALKFTMDDIASRLSISKKTIYKVFKDKNELFLAMVEEVFNNIKECEAVIMADERLSTTEKLRAVMAAMPDSLLDIDLSKMSGLKEKYPETYEQVKNRLESGWEGTISLLIKGIEEGVFRPVNIPIFRLAFSATLEQFFSRDLLEENNLTYSEALSQVTELLISGIEIK